jgi:hypothetical protein
MRMPLSLGSSQVGEEGQVLIEYILMLSVCVGLLIGVQRSFRGSVFIVWKQLANEISAACPKGCVRSPDIR